MAVNYNAAVRAKRMEAVIEGIDDAPTPGKIQIGTAGMATVLVIITLPDPSFTESNGVITMAGVPLSGVATDNGQAAEARILDGDDLVVVAGLSVGTTAPAEVTLNSITIGSGQTITLTSGEIRHSGSAA